MRPDGPARFVSPASVLSTMSAESPLPCRIGASKPRSVVGEGLGWVEHRHTESPGTGVRPVFVSHTLPGRGLKARTGAKAWLRSFAPDCGERTISAGTSPRFGSRFRGFRRSVSIGGEPVAIVACLLRSALWGAGLVEGSLSQCLIPQSVWGWGGWEGVCHGSQSFQKHLNKETGLN